MIVYVQKSAKLWTVKKFRLKLKVDFRVLVPESDAAAFAYTLQGGVGAAQMELSEESKIPRTFFFG